jgi:hypothetical protein
MPASVAVPVETALREDCHMDRFRAPLTVSKTIVLAAIAIGASIVTIAQLRAQEDAVQAEEETVKAEAEPSQLAKDLVGTWEIVGRPTGEQFDINSLKFFTGKHWIVANFDDNGQVQYSHGGTYTLDGDQYAETIKFAGGQTAALIGQTFKFKITVEGDKYTQIGVGNNYDEVWRRAK